MTELRLENICIPTAPLRADNPLPPLFGTGNRGYTVDMENAPEEIKRHADYGRVGSVAPYQLQDDYDRDKRDIAHPVAILDNGILRATFLLNAGGRLWSLVHVPTERELLFRNDVLQPANLALRNAWFAGGVEWNVGTIGHAPGTFSPIYAARVRAADGSPALRMWEFDRIRRMTYQIDVHLPEGARVLTVVVRLMNPSDGEKPSYWWSNIAVPQTEGTRVLAGADQAWCYAYSDRLETVPVVDERSGRDITYPGRSRDAADYFFDVEDQAFPWIAALEEDGTGLVQVSTPRLRGRKLFLWGRGAGGEHWQEWLNGPGQSYIEIQAGLARTQFEHVPVPARGHLRWAEAYGLLEVPPAAAHGEWSHARRFARTEIEGLITPAELDRMLASDIPDRPIEEMLHIGSAWGALDAFLQAGGCWGATNAITPFPIVPQDSCVQDWVQLFETGAFPHDDPHGFPRSFDSSEEWLPILQRGVGWVEAALLGQCLAAADDLDGAERAWLQSMERTANVVALRNLAALAQFRGHLDESADRYAAAIRMAPDLRPLAVEAVGAHIRAGRHADALEVIELLAENVRCTPRIRLLEAKAAIGIGDLHRAAEVLEGPLEIADLREGEAILHETWWDYRAAVVAAETGQPLTEKLRSMIAHTEPVPRNLDFRMSAASPSIVDLDADSVPLDDHSSLVAFAQANAGTARP